MICERVREPVALAKSSRGRKQAQPRGRNHQPDRQPPAKEPPPQRGQEQRRSRQDERSSPLVRRGLAGKVHRLMVDREDDAGRLADHAVPGAGGLIISVPRGRTRNDGLS